MQQPRIFFAVALHEKYALPTDALYTPIQAGAAIHPPLGLMRDDTGENISAKISFLRSCGFGYSLHRRINTIAHCKKPHLHPERKCVLDIFLVHRKCRCYNFIVEKFTAVP